MIIISTKQPYIHVDEDGTRFAFRYITGRNQEEYNKAVSAYSDGLRKLEKIEKLNPENVNQGDIEELESILDGCNKTLSQMLLVSVNDVEYKDVYEEFLIDLPVNHRKQFYDMLYKVLPILSGAEKGELKN